MDQPVYLLTDFSLKKTFTLLLQSAGMGFGYSHPSANWAEVISLKRVNHPEALIYASPIALKLASWMNQSVNTIAYLFVQKLQAQIDDSMDNSGITSLPSLCASTVLAAVTVQATEVGMIQFLVHDQAIASWLESLLQIPLVLPAAANLTQTCSLSVQAQFQIQYTHARCCSLLKLAGQQGLITLSRRYSNESPFFWRITHPDSIPWLTSTGRFQLSHSTDRQLIQALVNAIDDLTGPSAMTSQGQRALIICQAFQSVHRLHPLLADKTPVALPRILVYLALVRITQQVLFYSLTRVLNLPAPVDL